MLRNVLRTVWCSFGSWSHKVKFLFRLWAHSSAKICVRTCDMTSRIYFGKQNSTLGSVVSLAMFFGNSKWAVFSWEPNGSTTLILKLCHILDEDETKTSVLYNATLVSSVKSPNSHTDLPTPSLNKKMDSGNSYLQDLARWWRTSKGVDIPKISQFYWALFEKMRFWCFYIIKSSKKRAKIPLNLASEGLKYAPEVRIRHETCSTICGTHVQAILNQTNLTGLAGGFREGQNRSKYCPE